MPETQETGAGTADPSGSGVEDIDAHLSHELTREATFAADTEEIQWPHADQPVPEDDSSEAGYGESEAEGDEAAGEDPDASAKEAAEEETPDIDELRAELEKIRENRDAKQAHIETIQNENRELRKKLLLERVEKDRAEDSDGVATPGKEEAQTRQQLVESHLEELKALSAYPDDSEEVAKLRTIAERRADGDMRVMRVERSLQAQAQAFEAQARESQEKIEFNRLMTAEKAEGTAPTQEELATIGEVGDKIAQLETSGQVNVGYSRMSLAQQYRYAKDMAVQQGLVRPPWIPAERAEAYYALLPGRVAGNGDATKTPTNQEEAAAGETETPTTSAAPVVAPSAGTLANVLSVGAPTGQAGATGTVAGGGLQRDPAIVAQVNKLISDGDIPPGKQAEALLRDIHIETGLWPRG